MLLLALLVAVFAAVHAAPAHVAVKNRLKTALGKAFGPLYGLLSLLLLAAMLWAYRMADPGIVYDVPSWGRYANFLLTLLGFLCLGIFLFRGSWRGKLRYPMALGVLLWAAGHLLANGDGKSLIFFGGLAAAAVLQAALMARAGEKPAYGARQGHDLLSILAGLALYALAAQLHYAVTGVSLVELR